MDILDYYSRFANEDGDILYFDIEKGVEKTIKSDEIKSPFSAGQLNIIERLSINFDDSVKKQLSKNLLGFSVFEINDLIFSGLQPELRDFFRAKFKTFATSFSFNIIEIADNSLIVSDHPTTLCYYNNKFMGKELHFLLPLSSNKLLYGCPTILSSTSSIVVNIDTKHNTGIINDANKIIKENAKKFFIKNPDATTLTHFHPISEQDVINIILNS